MHNPCKQLVLTGDKQKNDVIQQTTEKIVVKKIQKHQKYSETEAVTMTK